MTREEQKMASRFPSTALGIIEGRIHGKKVDLRRKDIDEASAQWLSGRISIEGTATFTELDLSNNRIGGYAAKNIIAALRDSTRCASLDLSDNAIGPYILDTLPELRSRSSLRVLNLSSNAIGNLAAKRLGSGLNCANSNCHITNLNLANNVIGDTGATSIAGILKSEKLKITNLNLANNVIGDDGATSIAKALISCENRQLAELNLGCNNIGKDGARAIRNAVRDNRNITANIYLGENKEIPAQVMQEINDALEANRHAALEARRAALEAQHAAEARHAALQGNRNPAQEPHRGPSGLRNFTRVVPSRRETFRDSLEAEEKNERSSCILL